MDSIFIKEEIVGSDSVDPLEGTSIKFEDSQDNSDQNFEDSKANMDRLKEELEESLNNQEEKDTSWEQSGSSRVHKEKRKERSKKEIEEEEREKMQVLVSNFTEDQLNHYEMFRRAAFPKAAIKREIKPQRMSVEQREVMLRFMKLHPALGCNKLTTPDGAKLKKRLLAELTNILNNCSNGASKQSDKWLKSWQDWRSDVKSKAAKIRKHGGGPPSTLTLSPLEEELLEFLGGAAVEDYCVVDVLETPGSQGSFVPVPTDSQTSSTHSLADLCIPFSIPCSTLTIPSPTHPSLPNSPSPSNPSPTITDSPPSRKRRRNVRAGFTDSLNEPDNLLSLANEQLAVQKRQLEVAERQLQMSEKMYELQVKQGDRYGAALETIADSLSIAAAALAKHFNSKD